MLVIETFEIEEVINEENNTNKEHLDLMEELGLDAQLDLSKGSEKPFPFREMKKDEQYVYRTLCRATYDISQYKRSTIPFRVLSIYKLAKDYEFTKFEIWDTEEQAEKDPVLVAYKGSTLFILARWGEHLESLEDLKKKALVIANMKFKKFIKKLQNTCKTILDSNITDIEMFPLDYYGKPNYEVNYISDLDRLI